MAKTMAQLSFTDLSGALALVLIVAFIHWRWSLKTAPVFYGLARMFMQLIAVGFVLNFIFNQTHPLPVAGVLLVMIGAAGWISLRPVAHERKRLLPKAFLSIAGGGSITLAVIILAVIRPSPWFNPRVVLPLAGMIYANAMTGISLAADRFFTEIRQGKSYPEARNSAYRTALIPIMNSFFAVGLVALPGLMTGQILAGVSPFIAVRYQVMVMCMILGSVGISSAIFLRLMRGQVSL